VKDSTVIEKYHDTDYSVRANASHECDIHKRLFIYLHKHILLLRLY